MIQLLGWEPTYAVGYGPKKMKRRKERRKENFKKGKKRSTMRGASHSPLSLLLKTFAVFCTEE